MKTTARTTSTWAAKPAPSRPACATTSKRAPSGPDATVVEVLAPPRPRKKGTVAIPCLSAFNAAETARKLHRQRLVADAFRLGAFFAQAFLLVGFVFLIVAVEEGHLRIAFERQDGWRCGPGTSDRARSPSPSRRTPAARLPARAGFRRPDRSTVHRAAARCRP